MYRQDAEAYELRQIAKADGRKNKHYTGKSGSQTRRINNPDN
jgi:hypothetical protein